MQMKEGRRSRCGRGRGGEWEVVKRSNIPGTYVVRRLHIQERGCGGRMVFKDKKKEAGAGGVEGRWATHLQLRLGKRPNGCPLPFTPPPAYTPYDLKQTTYLLTKAYLPI